jgi:hypothetical protein
MPVSSIMATRIGIIALDAMLAVRVRADELSSVCRRRVARYRAVKGISTSLLSREQRVVARKEDEAGGMYE